jgi:hypothetical protein
LNHIGSPKTVLWHVKVAWVFAAVRAGAACVASSDAEPLKGAVQSLHKENAAGCAESASKSLSSFVDVFLSSLFWTGPRMHAGW